MHNESTSERHSNQNTEGSNSGDLPGDDLEPGQNHDRPIARNSLQALPGKVDGLERQMGGLNTKVDTLNFNMGTLNSKMDTLNSNVDTINSTLAGVVYILSEMRSQNNQIITSINGLAEAFKTHQMQPQTH